MGVVNLVRPDGSIIQVNEADAETLRQSFGYQDENESTRFERNVEEGKEEFYDQFGQRVQTALEGGISGATFGLSDPYLNRASDGATAERAKYNPGYRLGGEIVGALVTALPTGGTSVGARGAGIVGKTLAKTPAGMVTRGAEAVAQSTKLGRAGRTGVSAAIEGGAFGAGSAISNAELTGDPLTAESVIAGIGWGTIFGGGVGYGVGGVLGKLESRAANAAEKAATRELDDTLASLGKEAPTPRTSLIDEGTWQTFHASVANARRSADEALATAAVMVDDTTASLPSRVKTSEALTTAQDKLLNEITVSGKWAGAEGAAARNLRTEVLAGQKKLVAAANDGSLADDVFADMVAEHNARVVKLAEITGAAQPAAPGFAFVQKQADNALKEMKELSKAREVLTKLPATVDGFAATTHSKIEKLTAAIDTFMATSSAELEPVRSSLVQSIDGMAASMGVTIDGGPAEKLRAIHEIARASRTKAGKKAMAEAGQFFGEGAAARAASTRLPEAGGVHLGGAAVGAGVGYAVDGKEGAYSGAALGATGVFRRGTVNAAGGIAVRQAEKAGAGPISKAYARAAGRSVVAGFAGVKGMVLNSVDTAVNGWAPKILRGVEKTRAPGRAEPLRMKLDGTMDHEKATRKELMRRRAEEVRNASVNAGDVLYRAVEPLSGSHPDFTSALHAEALRMFNALTAHVPRDPGTAMSRMRSLWKPDDVAVERFARKWEVFHNPVPVVQRALSTGRIHPESAAAIREFYPQLFSVMRAGMLARLSEPGVLDKLTYSEQIGLGQMLGLTIHSTQDPRFIAAQQMMYQQRNEPLTTRPPGGSASNNPSGGRPSDSPAQRISQH